MRGELLHEIPNVRGLSKRLKYAKNCSFRHNFYSLSTMLKAESEGVEIKCF